MRIIRSVSSQNYLSLVLAMYHPMRDAALERTRRLLVHLAPFLKPQPDGAPQSTIK